MISPEVGSNDRSRGMGVMIGPEVRSSDQSGGRE